MAQPIVGIFDSNSRQIAASANIMKASVKPQAKLMEHPVEDGSTIVDNRVILPINLELSIIMNPDDYRDIYSQFFQLFTRSTMVTIQTKTARYPRMIIEGMPHEESPEFFDTITMVMAFREVKVVKATYGTVPLEPSQVSNPADASTVNNGQVQKKSAAKDLLDKALSSFGG